MSRNIHNLIRRKPSLGLPKSSDGFDGDLSMHTTSTGLGLYGKVQGRWHKFGVAQEVNRLGKQNRKKKLFKQDLSVKDIDIDKTVNIGKTAITTNPKKIFSTTATHTDYLYISSKVFDVESSSTASKLYIGDISLQPTWGTTGSTIQLASGSGHGTDLTIGAAGTTGTNKDGGNINLVPGAGTGTGHDGVVSIGYNAAGDVGTGLDIFSSRVRIKGTNKLYFGSTSATAGELDTSGNTYIFESGTDILDFYAGGVNMLKLDETNDKIQFKGGAIELLDTTDTADKFTVTVAASGVTTLATVDDGATVGHLTLDVDGSLIFDPADGKYIAKNNGTEFSAADSAYAGMILGYTRLEGDLSSQVGFEIENALTVEDDTHQITFTTPPSELVEIEVSCFIDIGSNDTKINVGLSSASATSGYSALSQELEYDAGNSTMFSDDEQDDNMLNVKFICKASHLASVGSSNTFYIGFSTGNVTKTANLRYGLRASHNACYPPMIIKATALPATIYDGQ